MLHLPMVDRSSTTSVKASPHTTPSFTMPLTQFESAKRQKQGRQLLVGVIEIVKNGFKNAEILKRTGVNLAKKVLSVFISLIWWIQLEICSKFIISKQYYCLASNIDGSIAKYFESSRKRDLSDGSKTSKERKKNLKGPTSPSSKSDECDILNEALDEEDSRGILANCLKKFRERR